MRNILSVNVDENYFDVSVQLCRPNRTPIDNLSSIYNKKLHVKLGNIHEFSFSIPYYISRNHMRIENPLLKKLKLGYLVYLEFKNYKEYFIVMDDSKSLSSSGDTINFKLKSLAYRLSKFDVRDIEVESYTLSQLMLGTPEINGILSETNWTLGRVDVDFDLLYRSYSVTTSTVLQCIFEIAEKFGAMPRFNTVTRKVDFIHLESSGIDRGFRAKEGINLESWGVDATIEEIVTRLKCYGQDGLEFRSLSPNGANHIQDFSYWMYPFECDANYNVIKSSDYMTDELCIALTKYNDLTRRLTGQFNSLVQQKTAKEDEKVQREKELSDLETELKNLNHTLDLINLTYFEQAPNRQDWRDLQPKLNNKEAQINSKLQQITQIENSIKSLESQMLNLQRQLATENNFTLSQIDELKDYIYVKDFNDPSIVEEKDLLEAGVKVFAKYREPKTSIKFTIADFIKDMKFKADKGKINLGDIATFESKRLGIEIQTRITEIDYDLDKFEHTITISNDINRNSDEDLLADLLSKVSTTSLTLDAKLYTIDKSKHTGTMVDQMLNSAFDTGKQHLLGGFESTNEMTERGFYSRSIHNPTMDFLVINGGAMYITRSGGRDVQVAINSDGCIREKAKLRTLNGGLYL